ncbi:MAG: acyl-CoA dehydrogenase family protein [Butyricicoccaceae bacterium]
MDFHLTREQELVRQMMHDFTENEVKPIAAETDKTSTYPRENIEKLFDLGVMGMIVPEEFGGAGADDLSSAIAIEELSKQCASTGGTSSYHNGLCCGPIIANGTPEQKEKYLRMLTEGHKVGAFALTEPDAGSDAAKGTCVAELQGDHYVLNGSKIFITTAMLLTYSDCICHDRQVQGHQGHFCIHRRELLPGLLCWQARGEAACTAPRRLRS